MLLLYHFNKVKNYSVLICPDQCENWSGFLLNNFQVRNAESESSLQFVIANSFSHGINFHARVKLAFLVLTLPLSPTVGKPLNKQEEFI